MKVINSWRDMEPHGIGYLTGEACAYGIRILCDLNDDGIQLLTAYFGLTSGARFAEPWNSRVNGKEATGSILLAKDSLFSLGRFIFFLQGLDAMIVTPSGYFGVTLAELEELNDLEGGEVYRNYSPANAVRDRIVHEMSGRVT